MSFAKKETKAEAQNRISLPAAPAYKRSALLCFCSDGWHGELAEIYVHKSHKNVASTGVSTKRPNESRKYAESERNRRRARPRRASSRVCESRSESQPAEDHSPLHSVTGLTTFFPTEML